MFVIRFHRSARTARGRRLPEALGWAKEVAEYINSNYSEATILVFAEQYGAAGTIHWYADYEDIATLDRIGSQLLADEGYQSILDNAAELFIEGSINDTVMASV